MFELACFVLGDNICYLSEKIQKIILWFGENLWPGMLLHSANNLLVLAMG